jgi:hypothetical protein
MPGLPPWWQFSWNEIICWDYISPKGVSQIERVRFFFLDDPDFLAGAHYSL